MIENAKVTIARWSPETRIAGMPITSPISPAKAPANSIDKMKGTPAVSNSVCV